MREIVLDTETTGLSYKNGDRIIEVGCVELINHVPSNNNLQFYCSTDVVVNEGAAKVHGLTNSFLRDYPSFENQSKKLFKILILMKKKKYLMKKHQYLYVECQDRELL